MATYTPNFNLSMPDDTDNFADFRESYNENMETIDENLGGGGGSSVVANPVDPPTDDLLTVEIDGTVYAIPGGGGETSLYTADVLYDNGTNNATLNLAHPITDYDQIILVGYAPADGTDYRKTSVYDVTYIEDFIGTTTKLGVTGDAWYCWYTIADASTLTRTGSSTLYVRTVIGVKYGESRGSVYKADVLLSSPGADLSTINLAHPITDYDQILFIGRSQADSTEYRLTAMYDAEFISQNLGTGAIFGLTGDAWYLWYSFTDASTMSKAANSWIWLETIIGIKYGNSAYQREVLLSDSPNTSPLVLSGEITDYDQILLIGRSTASGTEHRVSTLYDVNFIKNFLGTTVKFGVTTDSWYSWYMFATASSMNRHNSNQLWVFSVIGMKFVGSTGSKGHTVIDENGNEMPSRKNLHFTGAVEVTDDEINNETLVNILGGGGETELESTVIFEATAATVVNTDYSLSRPIDDFDFISIYNGVWSEWNGTGQKWGEDAFIPVDTLNRMYDENKQYAITSYSTRYIHMTIHQSTFRVIANSSLDICKIVGHKLVGGGGGGVNYSDTEQKIGTWTENGVTVDLYQRTIIYQCLDNANFQDAYEITNEDIKEMVYEFKISDGDIVIDRWVQQDFWEVCVGTSTITGNLAIMVKRYTNFAGWKAPKFICTIRYTKSS